MTGLWEKVVETAKSALLLHEAACFNAAYSRAYYAMFTAARILLSEREGIPLEALKTDASVTRLFSLHFVKQGEFAPELAKAFRRASQERGAADYSGESISRDECSEILLVMHDFLDIAARLSGRQKLGVDD